MQFAWLLLLAFSVMMKKETSDYPFELVCVDAGCCIRAGFYFYGRAFSNYRIACTRGFTSVRLIRRRDNVVLFSYNH